MFEKIKEAFEDFKIQFLMKFDALKDEALKKIDVLRKDIENNSSRNRDWLINIVKQKSRVEYVLLNDKTGFLNGYFFNDHDPDSHLRKFRTCADIKVGDCLYLRNNFYEEMSVTVKARTYDVANNRFCLEVVPNMKLSDYSETEDFENEVKWLMDDKFVREDAKRELEEAKEVSEQWNGLEGEKLEEALDYFAEYVILDRLESKSLRDSTALLYRIREIGEEFRGRKFVRPDRSDYSEF